MCVRVCIGVCVCDKYVDVYFGVRSVIPSPHVWVESWRTLQSILVGKQITCEGGRHPRRQALTLSDLFPDRARGEPTE